MLNVTLNKVNPFAGKPVTPGQTYQTRPETPLNERGFAAYTADHVKANFLPSLSFKGIHKDAVVGVETKIVGISKYQQNAERLMYRRLNRLKKGTTEKIQLDLKREPDNSRDSNAIAVYHTYKGKPMKLGYLAAPMAKEVAPLMDKGYRFNASVVDVAGGNRSGYKYIGVKTRLEYLSSKERSPADRKLDDVKQAFQNCMDNKTATRYQEEMLIESKVYPRATKMKVDLERQEVTVYQKGWEQMRGELSAPPNLKNSRNHPQNKTFIDHVKNTVDYLVKKVKPEKTNKSE